MQKKHFIDYGFEEGRTGSSDDDYNFKFEKWRREIGSTFKKYIFLKKEIQDKIDDIFANINSKIISVHCRHPSAFCESGLVLLKDYYKEIDIILKEFPDAKIFLATDSDFVIASFEFNYEKKLIYIYIYIYEYMIIIIIIIMHNVSYTKKRKVCMHMPMHLRIVK